METSRQRRKRKLIAFCEDNGGFKAVAEKAGLNATYLEQIIKGYEGEKRVDGTRGLRHLGDPAAEAIEDAYSLGRGWFDNDASADPFKMSDDALALAFIYEKLEPADRRYLIGTARGLDAARRNKGGLSGLGEDDEIGKQK